MRCDARVDVLNLALQDVHQFDDPRLHIRVRGVLALTFTDLQADKLPPTGHQRMQALLRLICHRPGEAIPVWAFVDHFGQLCQHQHVDAIRLCQPAHRLREISRLSGIDYRHPESCGLQGAGTGKLVAASGLHDDE